MERKYVKLYKSGAFYNAFDDDGIILHELLGFKFVEYKNSVGFPERSLSKVKAALDNEKITYEIYDKETLLEEVKGIEKNYKIVLKRALNNYEVEKRANRLKDKVNDLKMEDLEKLFSSLEDKTLGE